MPFLGYLNLNCFFFFLEMDALFGRRERGGRGGGCLSGGRWGIFGACMSCIGTLHYSIKFECVGVGVSAVYIYYIYDICYICYIYNI